MELDLDLITGTTVHYYVTCKREAWLYAHKIAADQEDENILMGKALAQIKEEQLPDFGFGHLKIDKVAKQKGHYLITEYKKSLKNPEGAKMQLLFYMYLLKKSLHLRSINGKVISGKKVLYMEGSEENMRKMEELLHEMQHFLAAPKPPKPVKIPFCKKCGYRNYCF